MAATNLTGIYARVAERAGDEEITRLLAALRAEPEPHGPHITQALDAFTNEARKRGLENTQ
jgi:hypothetical protein